MRATCRRWPPPRARPNLSPSLRRSPHCATRWRACTGQLTTALAEVDKLRADVAAATESPRHMRGPAAPDDRGGAGPIVPGIQTLPQTARTLVKSTARRTPAPGSRRSGPCPRSSRRRSRSRRRSQTARGAKPCADTSVAERAASALNWPTSHKPISSW